MEYQKITLLTDLALRIDKRAVLDSINCRESGSAYGVMSTVFDQLVQKAKTMIAPQAAYVFDRRQPGLAVGELSSYEYTVPCLVSVGSVISEQITELFQTGQYAEGLIIDAIANYALFDCSNQLRERLVCEAEAAGLGLSRRFSPGEGQMSLDCQRDILERFSAAGAMGISITNGNMLNPMKSMTYIYGADAGLPRDGIDHDCSLCSRQNCQLRAPGKDQYVNLTVKDGRRTITIQAKTAQTIMSALAENGIQLHSLCGGSGRCGKCKIRVLEGLVTSDRIGEGQYLSCRARPLTDCTINIAASAENAFQTVTDFQGGVLPSSDIKLIPASLTSQDWQTGDSVTRLINTKTGKPYTFSLKALCKLADAQSNHASESTRLNLLVRDDKVMAVFDVTAARPLGLAIDIGTTTVVLAQVDLLSGEIIKTRSVLNSQRRFGADVISRILSSEAAGNAALRKSICTDIAGMIQELGDDVKHFLAHIVIAGNTTMLHFLLGLPAGAMGRHPFQPVTTDLQEFSFADLFDDSSIDCQVTILPGISAFVGADIMAGLLHCGFAETESVAMLMDIGTNGEIVIGNKHKILCLSTAAGPAFEGANISCGTGSVSGAIASFQKRNGNNCFTTIEGKEPVGVCGSGIIDIMAACIKERIIDETGKFDSRLIPGGVLQIAQNPCGEWLCFEQKDIRELQLAKSAMRTGMEVLIKHYGCRYEDVTAVYLAGSFGAHINIDSAVCIGLLPEELKGKVKTVGNSALGGAVHYLLKWSAKQALSSLITVSNHIDLAADPDFNTSFMQNMYFRLE